MQCAIHLLAHICRWFSLRLLQVILVYLKHFTKQVLSHTPPSSFWPISKSPCCTTNCAASISSLWCYPLRPGLQWRTECRPLLMSIMSGTKYVPLITHYCISTNVVQLWNQLMRQSVFWLGLAIIIAIVLTKDYYLITLKNMFNPSDTLLVLEVVMLLLYVGNDDTDG